MGTRLQLVAAFCFVLSNVYAGTNVDPRDWVKAHEGDYTIEKAGGVAPKPENNLSNVFADTDDGVLTMPFCRNNEPCNVGYVFLPYKDTTITEDVLSGVSRVTIQVKEKTRTLTYYWTQNGASAVFRNPQFVLGGATVSMEHQLTKVSN